MAPDRSLQRSDRSLHRRFGVFALA